MNSADDDENDINKKSILPTHEMSILNACKHIVSSLRKHKTSDIWMDMKSTQYTKILNCNY